DDNITLDRSGGAIPVPVTIDGGGGSNSLTLANLTVGSTWTWDGTHGTVTSSPLNTDFHLISFTAIGSVAAGGPGANSLTGPSASASGSVTTTVNGANQTLDATHTTLNVAA